MMKDATVLRVVRSDGAEMEFSGAYNGGWMLAADGLDDFLDLPLEVSTSPNVLTDGSSLVGKRVEECERTASVVYAGADVADARNEALSFFNPKFSFSVHVTHLGRTRWCEGELLEASFPLVKETYGVSGAFTLLCCDPYMRSESGNENSLTDSKPMFGFPYVCHARAPMPDGKKYPVGAPADVAIYDGQNTVYNSGDVETAYKIVCRFNGSVSNPTFTKDGRFVKLLRQFADHDELVIDFTAAPPRVTVNGQNAIQACSRDSNFTGMQMQVGANVFNYSCADASKRPLMDVQIRFYKRYLGI